MQTEYVRPSDPAAAEVFSGFMTSENISGRWGRHYFGERHDNPVKDLLVQVEVVSDNLKQSPHLVKFMLETARLVEGALAHSSAPDKKNLSDQVKGLSLYLSRLMPADNLPAKEDLPEEWQKLLVMIEKDTAQHPIRPIHSTALFFKNYIEHICEHVRKEPYHAGGAFVVSVGFLWLVNSQMGNISTGYIDPTAATITNPGVGEFGIDYNFDPTISTEGLEPVCHSHIVSEHCSKFKTIAQDVQASAEQFYNTVNSRIEGIIQMPLTDLFSKAVDSEAFMRGFENGAKNTAEVIYGLNAIENITLHYVIGKMAFDQGRKLGRRTSEEARESWQKITNFTWRTLSNAPLAYGLGGGAAFCSYAAHGGFNPEMVWTGLAGALGGQIIHKACTRYFNRASRGEQIAQNAHENLAAFSHIASDYQTGSLGEKSKNYKGIKTAATLGGAAASFAVFATEFPEMAGYIAGTASVTGSFLAYNVPEDVFLHLIFGAAGGVAGYGYGAIEKNVPAMFRRTDALGREPEV